MTPPQSHNTTLMQCMEVWGGNAAVDADVAMPGLDAWVYSRPWGGDIGGDVHYLSSCATGRITRILLADVSGHGASVATAASQLRDLMRRFVNQLDQSRFVSAINESFPETDRQGRFATSVVATFFSPTNTITLSNAGHPPPLHYSASKRSWSLMQPSDNDQAGISNIPLGVVAEGSYTTDRLTLDVGDLVVFYTDALIEARRPDGRLLGVDGLLDAVRSIEVTDPRAAVAALIDRIRADDPDDLESDDLTVLVFRPNGGAAQVPLRDRLLAPLRIVRELARSLFPGGRRPALPDVSLVTLGGAMIGRFNRLWTGRSP